MGGATRIALVGLAVAATPSACRAPATATPTGNVVLFVDTDAPVPTLASQLRIDLFDANGNWYASRDVSAASPSSWPVSFGVYLPDGEASGQVLVRLRAYPAGQVQDYRGYSYQPRPTSDSPTTLVPSPPATNSPRLVVDGVDVTPATEPLPALAIDQLVLVPLTEGVLGSVSTTLAGACFGTMADLRDFTSPATCVDTEAQLSAVAPATVSSSLVAPPTVEGTLQTQYAQPCTGSPRPPTTAADGTPLYDDDVCVVGGTFVLGSYDNAIDDPSDDWPPQIAFVPSFYMDRYEVTVGRYRAAVAAGLSPGVTYANDGPIGTDESDPSACTYSDTPMGREDLPLTCVTLQDARAFCQALGGDLPLEVQWEYAATMSGGRPAKTSYAWGDGTDALPGCSNVVYARGSVELATFCDSAGFGPASVAISAHPVDVSIGLSIVDLGGNVDERALDTFASRQADCWVGASLELPACRPGMGSDVTIRGGSWGLAPDQIVAAERDEDQGGQSPVFGFRCVRPGTSP